MAETPESPADRPAKPAARPGRAYARTVGGGVLGAVLAFVAARQDWATATVDEPAVRTVGAAGTDVAPVFLPLVLVCLAALGAFVVLRVNARRVVAALALLAGIGALVALASGIGDAETVARQALTDGASAGARLTLWPVAAGLGALVATAAGAVALLRAGGWPEMSRRYDSPAEQSVTTGSDSRDLWRALDDGEDPTA